MFCLFWFPQVVQKQTLGDTRTFKILSAFRRLQKYGEVEERSEEVWKWKRYRKFIIFVAV